MEEPARQALSRVEFEKLVVTRARQDAAFKARLLSDAKAALREAYGLDIPEAVELTAVEETPSRFFLVLPVNAAELSDEELGAVAGGVSGMSGSAYGIKGEGPTSVAISGSGFMKW